MRACPSHSCTVGSKRSHFATSCNREGTRPALGGGFRTPPSAPSLLEQGNGNEKIQQQVGFSPSTPRRSQRDRRRWPGSPKPVPRGARAAWDRHRAGTAARAPPLTPAAAARLPRDCCRAESCCRFYHASLSKCCTSPGDGEKQQMDSSALNPSGAHGGRDRQKWQQRALT